MSLKKKSNGDLPITLDLSWGMACELKVAIVLTGRMHAANKLQVKTVSPRIPLVEILMITNQGY